jgi:hypothetical protein
MKRKRSMRPMCKRCGHEKAFHVDGPCGYGSDHPYGGGVSVFGVCPCPGFNARRSIPDREIAKSPDELELERLTKEAQAALDRLCAKMKEIVRSRRLGDIEDPQALLAPTDGESRAKEVFHEKKTTTATTTATATAPTPKSIDLNGEFKLGKLGQRILNVLAHETVYSKEELAILCGQSHGGGHFTNTLGAMRSAGLISGLIITTEGRKRVNGAVPSRDTLRAEWYAKIGKLGTEIIEYLRTQKRGVDKYTIAEAVGREAAGGHFTNTLGHLRNTLALVHGYDNEIRVNEVLR